MIFKYESENDEGQIAVNDISFEIERGSFTAILGPNGSGKSTLAKNINALLLPTGGKIYVNGIDTSDDDMLWEIRQTAGMVFQNPDNQLVSSIVEDDVAFGPENLGIDPAEIRIRVDESMESVGIYDLRDKAPHLLSGGQKQRVAIAGVLAMKPQCIILDEPTAMLDPQGRGEVMEIIKNLNKEGITIVLITHFMEEAAQADRIIVMEAGKVIMDGSPETVFSDVERIKASGLDVPPAIELRGMLKNWGIDVPDNILSISQLADFLCG